MSENKLDKEIRRLSRFTRELIGWAFIVEAPEGLVQELFEAGKTDYSGNSEI
ncbi:hypothetical protein LCGC14_1120020 [marine sediment metagenome]|uniref:Uncharacterized protein n=1 Tax=marine sediment metagenome TaxID=412755 RepID=A0A0F9MS21_9ZZZZ